MKKAKWSKETTRRIFTEERRDIPGLESAVEKLKEIFADSPSGATSQRDKRLLRLYQREFKGDIHAEYALKHWRVLKAWAEDKTDKEFTRIFENFESNELRAFMEGAAWMEKKCHARLVELSKASSWRQRIDEAEKPKGIDAPAKSHADTPRPRKPVSKAQLVDALKRTANPDGTENLTQAAKRLGYKQGKSIQGLKKFYGL